MGFKIKDKRYDTFGELKKDYPNAERFAYSDYEGTFEENDCLCNIDAAKTAGMNNLSWKMTDDCMDIMFEDL